MGETTVTTAPPELYFINEGHRAWQVQDNIWCMWNPSCGHPPNPWWERSIRCLSPGTIVKLRGDLVFYRLHDAFGMIGLLVDLVNAACYRWHLFTHREFVEAKRVSKEMQQRECSF